MQEPNTIVEDICAVIGYSATVRLVAWFGGDYLRIPDQYNPDHLLAKVIGRPAFKRLVEAMGGHSMFVPNDSFREQAHQMKCIYHLLRDGCSCRAIAAATNLSSRQVVNIRRRLEEIGLLPLVVKGRNAAS